MDQAEVVKQEVKQEEKKPRNYALADWKYEKIMQGVGRKHKIQTSHMQLLRTFPSRK